MRISVFALLAVACGPTPKGPAVDSGSPIDRDTAPEPTGSAQSCAIVETIRRECVDPGGNSTLSALADCQPGTGCQAPSPYNVEQSAIECVDQYRYAREVFPATCEEVGDYYAGLRDCLVPWHCSQNRDRAGDWRCEDGGCVCPDGGDCPTPGPPPGP